MDSSSSSLSSSWDIVNPTSITKKTIGESPNQRPLNAWKNDRARVGDKKCPTVRSGVDDINDAVISNQNDSNSSSDIDVIEDPDEDLFQMSFSSMNYSINSSKSAGSSASSIPPPVPVEVGWILLFQLLKRLLKNSIQTLWKNSLQILLENSQIKNYHVVVFVSVILVSALLFHGTPSSEMKDQVEKLKKENVHLKNQAISSKTESDKRFLILDEEIKAMRSENQKLSTPSNEMKDQIEKLKKENDNLKNQAISSKMESDKLLLILDEQIKAMRSENHKLSKSMQLLTKRMEEQSKTHRLEICGASPNCFSNFFSCFSETFLPRWR